MNGVKMDVVRRHPLLAWMLLISFLFLAWSDAGYAQEAAENPPISGAIEGRVLIKGVREPVIAAMVRVLGADLETATDEEGRFRFETVRPGHATLQVEDESILIYHVGVEVQAGQTARQDCYVEPSDSYLEEITVVGKKETEETARQEISREELVSVPGANNDVIRVVENMPGVAQTSVMGFGSDGLVIRGTGAEDSQYFLNGFQIPMLFHFGGWISVVNSELVDDIVYSPGGFNVSKGDAIGGIVEITTRSPRGDRVGGVVDLSNFASYFMIEGPAGEKNSWAATARRSFIDFILPSVMPEDEVQFTVAPRFYDYTAIWEYKPNSRNLFHFMALGADDAMYLLSEEDADDPLSGDSFDIWITWHRCDLSWLTTPNERFGNTLAVNFLYVEDLIKFGPDFSLEEQDYIPALRDDMTIRLGKWNELRTGVFGTYYIFDIYANIIRAPKEGDPGGADLASDEIFREHWRADVWQLSYYLDDVMQPADWVQIVPGARVDYLSYLGKSSVDPRLNINFMPTDKAKIKVATGVYHQWPGADEMVEDYGNDELDPEVAYLGNLGFAYDFGLGYSIDVQGYYKQLDHLVATSNGERPYENTGIGHVYGAELLARKQLTDRFFGWLSYTWSTSERKDGADEDWRYFDQDQRHNFIVLASYQLGRNKDWRIGGKWQYTTGTPYTKIDRAIYNADTDSYLPIYSEKVNEERNEDFHKLDVRVDKLWSFNTWQLNTYLDLQNVYLNEQAVGYAYNFDYSERKKVAWPSFMPSLGVQGRF